MLQLFYGSFIAVQLFTLFIYIFGVFIELYIILLSTARIGKCTSSTSSLNIVEILVKGFTTSILFLESVFLISLYLGLHPRLLMLILSLLAILLGVIGKFCLGECYSKITYRLKKEDVVFLILVFSLTLAYQAYTMHLPRSLTPDETSYIYAANILLGEKVVPAINVNPLSSMQSLLTGRFLWTSLIGLVLFFTGIPLHNGFVTTTMFIPLIPLTTLLIFSEVMRVHNAKMFLLVFLLSTNLSLLLFSSTALVEIPTTTLTLVVVYCVLRALRYADKGIIIDLKLDDLIYATIVLILLIDFKPNILFIATFLFFIAIEIMNRADEKYLLLRRVSKCVLTLVAIYIALVDFPCAIASYLYDKTGNPLFLNLKNLLVKFLILPISVGAHILGLFLETSEDPITFFSLSIYEKLKYLYAFISPDVFTMFISSVFLFSPLLFHKFGRSEPSSTARKIRTLFLSTYISFWLYYFIMVATPAYEDLLRYGVVIYPLISLSALYMMYQHIVNRKYSELLTTLLLGALTFTVMRFVIFSKYGGVKYFWAMNITQKDTFIFQFVMLFILTLATTVPSGNSKPLKKCITRIDGHLLLSILVLTYIVGNAYIHWTIVDGELHSNFIDSDLDFLTKYSSNYDIVLTNIYGWLRLYLKNTSFIATLPITSESFNSYLSLLPNGTAIILTLHKPIVWLDPCNIVNGGYSEKLFGLNKYCVNKTCIVLEKYIEGGNGIKVKVYRVVHVGINGEFSYTNENTTYAYPSKSFDDVIIDVQLINATHRMLKLIPEGSVPSSFCLLLHEYTFTLYYDRMLTEVKELINISNKEMVVYVTKPYKLLTPVSGALEVLIYDCNTGRILKHTTKFDFALNALSLALIHIILLAILLFISILSLSKYLNS